MSLTTSLMLLACGMALAASIGAFVVAVRSWRLSQSRASSALSTRLSDAEAAIDQLQLSLGRLRSRMNMQKNREKLPESTGEIDAHADPADTRAALNDALARGAIKATR